MVLSASVSGPQLQLGEQIADPFRPEVKHLNGQSDSSVALPALIVWSIRDFYA